MLRRMSAMNSSLHLFGALLMSLGFLVATLCASLYPFLSKSGPREYPKSRCSCTATCSCLKGSWCDLASWWGHPTFLCVTFCPNLECKATLSWGVAALPCLVAFFARVCSTFDVIATLVVTLMCWRLAFPWSWGLRASRKGRFSLSGRDRA